MPRDLNLPTSANRLLSLDVFRGMTIAAMILVNNPGSWNHVYAPLLHAEWHGATPTDWIFPFFLFIVGVSIALSLGAHKSSGTDVKPLMARIARRSVIIFGLGLFLSAYPSFDISNLRIPGVLQRIALVYAIAAPLYLWLNRRQLLFVAVICLIGYWALMTLVPVPGGVAPNLEAGTNLGAWLDRTVFGNHLWVQSKTWDPEGLLGTMPALATAISGIFAGLLLRSDRGQFEKIALLMIAGTGLLSVGLAWDMVFPINKQLWSSSYVLYTSGIALLALGSLYWWVDVKGQARGSRSFIFFGSNAIAIYVLSGIIARTLNSLSFTATNGAVTNAKSWLWTSVFQPVVDAPKLASLTYALAYTGIMLAIAWLLYRQKIFIKV